jgi:hypothetical protein
VAYSFNPYALPDLIGALLTVIMLYLLVKFAPENRVNLVLALYLFFASLSSLSLALIIESSDAASTRPWRAFSDLSLVVLFPLQIHFLLLYSERGRWFTHYPFHPAVLYTPAIFQLFFINIRWLFEMLFAFWVLTLYVVMAFSGWWLLKEPNAYRRAQNTLVYMFMLPPALWLLLHLLSWFTLPGAADWTAGWFFAASAGLAIYAMLRHQMLDTKVVLRSGLVIFISSIITGAAFFLALLIIAWLFGLPLQRDVAAMAVVIVVVLSWFFKPLLDTGTRLLEGLAPDLKWKECRLEQVFLMDYNGIRVASVRRQDSNIDLDLAGGMLTAVSEFLRDAFKAEKKDSVRTIGMGRFKLLVEHAPPVYMAIVFTGDETPELRQDVRAILSKVLAAHGEMLKQWDGNRAGMEDVDGLLQGLLAKSGIKPAAA